MFTFAISATSKRQDGMFFYFFILCSAFLYGLASDSSDSLFSLIFHSHNMPEADAFYALSLSYVIGSIIGVLLLFVLINVFSIVGGIAVLSVISALGIGIFLLNSRYYTSFAAVVIHNLGNSWVMILLQYLILRLNISCVEKISTIKHVTATLISIYIGVFVSNILHYRYDLHAIAASIPGVNQSSIENFGIMLNIFLCVLPVVPLLWGYTVIPKISTVGYVINATDVSVTLKNMQLPMMCMVMYGYMQQHMKYDLFLTRQNIIALYEPVISVLTFIVISLIFFVLNNKIFYEKFLKYLSIVIVCLSIGIELYVNYTYNITFVNIILMCIVSSALYYVALISVATRFLGTTLLDGMIFLVLSQLIGVYIFKG